jgi:Amt family ammonium transporter
MERFLLTRQRVSALLGMTIVGALLFATPMQRASAQETAAPADATDELEVTEPPAPEEVTLDSLKSEVDAAALAGHNAWMLTSCALVLFMNEGCRHP